MVSRGPRRRNLLPAVLATAVVLGGVRPARAQAVTSEQVRAAVQRGIASLRQTQAGDGSWKEMGSYRGGTTALAVLALLNAGVPAGDPAVSKGLAYLADVPNEKTYVVSLKAQAFAACGLANYRDELRRCAAWLAQTQNDNGMWGYGVRRARGRAVRYGRGDNSNTQFALLGLHEAAKAGVLVPRGVWQRAQAHFVHTQCRDGGWHYQTRQNKGYGSMTAAGVASLYICGSQLQVTAERAFLGGVYLRCGRYAQNKALAAGLDWLRKNFTVQQNPGRGGGWVYYYLYALERTGMISGLRTFGEHDWYRAGAAHLVAQQQPGGGWGARRGWSGQYQTAFALLFLAKGNRPVLIQKVKWDGHWNRNIHDLENLTAWIGEKLGQRATWQTTSLDRPMRELRQSPILFITGHEFPAFTKDQKETLRRFVETGGTLLFEACCGKPAFTTGFEAFAKEVFPDYPLRDVRKDHPVMRSFFKLKKDELRVAADIPRTLKCIDVGCRTAVFFSPQALSALWELRDNRWSEQAFQIGTNIAAYATGREQLPDRLSEVELPEHAQHAEQLAEVPRGAVRIARLIHEGDYNSDPHCLTNLAAQLRREAKVDVVARARHLHPTDPRLYEYPIVFMHGHFSFAYTDEQVRALRKYLDRGGVLVADACCGRKAFDASFRELVARLYPDEPLRPLAKDHPILSGRIGVPLGELRYRTILAEELHRRGTTHPHVEAVTHEGREVVLYSKYDYTCALEGDRPYSCRGYNDASGRKLALNIFLYAITF